VAGNITYMNGASAATNLDNTEWEFTGSAYFTSGQSFSVVHDDGTNMYINGVAVLLAGGPTPPVTSPFTYTGPTGMFSFDFIYTECCGGSADYKTTLVPSAPATGTPEPSAALLLMAGLSFFGVRVARRRKG
jgi:hypothetical protein